MNSRNDIERALDGFLAEGPRTVADQALVRTLDAIDRTTQRRGLFAPWRFSLMITLPRLAAVALVAVIAVGGAAYLLGSNSSVGRPAVSPTAPAPTARAATPIPTANDGMGTDTSIWTPFTTSRYGYTVSWPNTPVWIHSPATEDWAGQTAYDMWASSTNAPWVDKFYDQTTQVTVTAAAITIPFSGAGRPGQEAFIDAYLKPGGSVPATCPEPASAMRSTVIDGQPARETTRCGDQAAFVFVGRRFYVFSISAANRVNFLDAFLTTIRLGVDTSTWVPFTSANYGFTISHPGDWFEVPATSHFSYASIQPDSAADVLSSSTFDLTNYAAVPLAIRPVLLASEAKVPAGMTADALLQQFAIEAYGNACYPDASVLQKITVDGYAATLAYGGCTPPYYFAEASVVIGNRVWIFELRGQDRELILPFLSTLKLDPTQVVD